MPTHAALLQQIVIHPTAVDTAVVPPPPLPGGLSVMMRLLFNLPPWLQIAGVAVLAVVAVAVLWYAWYHSDDIARWLRGRSRGWKIALGAAALVAIGGAAGGGVLGWNYSMHDNSFCVSCHVMTPAFERFQVSAHKDLECHACHRQSIFTSMAQLYYWVADRPHEIPSHAGVPSRTCLECHGEDPEALAKHGGPNAYKAGRKDRAPGDTAWKHIIQTAGHSVHMRNDDPKLRGIACITCHGAEVHRFSPVEKTCGQANCHEGIRIQLGKMAGQTQMHCTGCHAFKASVAANIAPDSARVGLVPAGDQCFSCHQMQEKLADYDPAADAHKAICGSCHDPHKQKQPVESFATCASGNCHARADTLTPFHRGLPDGALADCGSCHQAHTWKVDGNDCQACHRDMSQPLENRGVHLRMRRSADARSTSGATIVVQDAAPRPHGPNADDWSAGAAEELAAAVPLLAEAPAVEPAAASDTLRFSHQRHRNVACKSCHKSERTHGELAIRTDRDCASCHHATEVADRIVCRSCHTGKQLATPRVVTSVAMASVRTEPRTRELTFDHGRHEKTECRTCHEKGPTLAFDRGCNSCHEDHHVAKAECRSCHTDGQLERAHPRAVVHAGCGGAGCHQDAAVTALPPARNVCVACHAKQVDHKPGRDCAACHQVRWQPVQRAAGAGGAPQ
jgi:hypothetical protein